MMGRAGRPQFDDKGVACILVHEPKKTFYRKFLYEPFPVESSLHEQLHDHVNAEIVNGAIRSKQDAVDFLTWTYFYRRLGRNPAYYSHGAETDASPEGISRVLSDLIETTVDDLEHAGCVELADDGLGIAPATLGKVASYYYLNYTTVALFNAELRDVDQAPSELPDILRVLCAASEYAQLPVRHNEEHVNALWAESLPWSLKNEPMESPHTKANLLLQAHFAAAPFPSSDYKTDLKSVLDQALRVLQAMVDIAADGGWMYTALGAMQLAQMVSQGRLIDDHPLGFLPGLERPQVQGALRGRQIVQLPQLLRASEETVRKCLRNHLSPKELSELQAILRGLPMVSMSVQPPAVSDLAPGDTSSIVVSLRCTNAHPLRRNAYAPRFHKHKAASGWWLAVGYGEELLALKRVQFGKQPTEAKLSFYVPEATGRGQCTLSVHLVSDSYIGLDQCHQFEIDIREEES